MPEHGPQIEGGKPFNTRWDVLSNRSYAGTEWGKLMEERTAEFNEAVQQNNFEYAQRLLLKGGLKDELTSREIADFARNYFEYHMSEYQRLRDPEEYRKLQDLHEGLSPDQFLLLRRHLERAVPINRVFGEFVTQEDREEFYKMSRHAAQQFFDLSVQRKKFSEILNWPEMHPILEKLDPNERRQIVTSGIRQYIEEEKELLGGRKFSERSRAYLSEWAVKYGVEDGDVLEILTEPE